MSEWVSGSYYNGIDGFSMANLISMTECPLSATMTLIDLSLHFPIILANIVPFFFG